MKVKLLRKLRKAANDMYRLITDNKKKAIYIQIKHNGKWRNVLSSDLCVVKNIFNSDVTHIYEGYKEEELDKAKKMCDTIRRQEFHSLCEYNLRIKRYTFKKRRNNIIY